MQKKLFVLLLLCSATCIVNAQFNTQIDNRRMSRRDIIPDSAIADKAAMGIGLGFDYGGIGVGGVFYPGKNFGIIAGVGYAIAGAGFNAGIKYRFFNANPRGVIPFLTAMYGYNAAVKLDYGGFNGNTQTEQKVYYGPTFGVGMDTKYGPGKQGYWSFALLVPIRSQDYRDAIDRFKAAGGSVTEPPPVGFSVGYRWVIN